MSLLFYKRPPYVAKQDGHLTECKRTGDTDCSNTSIPPELSFENVICNKCMPPCSLQDFLDYLMYVTHDAENLQFYLWMVDYFQRFSSAPKYERALSPRWKGHAPPIREQNGNRLIGTQDVDLHSEDISDCSTWGGEQSEFTDQYTQTLDDIKFSISPVKYNQAFAQLQWHPAEAQPFRNEITRIISHYLAPGSPRQLDLSHNDRATVLRALEYTTHPSALRPVKKMLDSTLRNQSHPNFVRWSICNGNKQWTYTLRAFAILNILLGFVVAIVLTLSRASRYWRIFAAIEWWFGITNIIAASQGLCLLLHRLHTRQYHAWETSSYSIEDDEAMLRSEDGNNISYDSTRSQWPVKMEVFGPANNYSGEAWVSSYARKPWYKKLFEKRVKVQETGLSSIQNRMIRQAEAWALLITVPLTVAFVAIPKANLF
ncbi:MAG: hypothetical protein Q9164_004703 [Protoblastenia rupestris]